jgi:hypothetical protein
MKLVQSTDNDEKEKALIFAPWSEAIDKLEFDARHFSESLEGL